MMYKLKIVLLSICMHNKDFNHVLNFNVQFQFKKNVMRIFEVFSVEETYINHVIRLLIRLSYVAMVLYPSLQETRDFVGRIYRCHMVLAQLTYECSFLCNSYPSLNVSVKLLYHFPNSSVFNIFIKMSVNLRISYVIFGA